MVPVHSFLSSVRRGGVSAAVALALALVVVPASPLAQDIPQTPAEPAELSPDFSQDAPAHIAVIDGAATLERDGRATAAEENVPLLAGDRLRTDDGRIEVLFADGSVLDIDKHTSLDLLSDSLLRMHAGRIRLSIARVTESLEYRIDAVGTTTTIRTAGEYRLGLSNPRATEPTVDLAVISGTAELASPAGRTLVRAGRRAFASEHTEPSLPIAFNSTEETEFDRWANDQRDARLGVVSSRYLPTELRSYGGAFDAYGDWQYEPTYGYVWYPRVAPTWQPYYYGGWSVVGSFGWVWVGGGRWCWPTHHYGRWNVHGGRWFWSPGRVWSPGWVSWAVSPGFVSWCPLGFNGRPAVALTSVGKFGHGWTAVSARSFNSRAVVVRTASTVRPTSLSGFSRSAAPRATGVRAGVEPLRGPSGVRAGVRAGVVSRDVGVDRPNTSPGIERPGNSPRAVQRGSSSTWPPPRDARTPVQPADPTPSDSPRRAGVRPVMPQTPDVPDRTPSARTPGDSGRSRFESSSEPRGSAMPRSRPPSTVDTPSSRASRPVMPAGPPASSGGSSSGWRRVAPPSPRSSGSDSPPPDRPSSPRAVPRGGSSSPAPSSPPPSASSPRSRGGQSAPPPSASSSSSSSSGSGRAVRRGGGGR
jgi:hypothetical protein